MGPVPRSACHGDPRIIHLVVHLHIFDGSGGLFLQKRSASKDLYPGRWDTAVGGHVHAGEGPREALLREALEELGVDASGAEPLYCYLHRNEHESEYVHTFGLRFPGPFRPDPEEVEEGKFFAAESIRALLGGGSLTPNFEDEYSRLIKHGEHR